MTMIFGLGLDRPNPTAPGNPRAVGGQHTRCLQDVRGGQHQGVGKLQCRMTRAKPRRPSRDHRAHRLDPDRKVAEKLFHTRDGGGTAACGPHKDFSVPAGRKNELIGTYGVECPDGCRVMPVARIEKADDYTGVEDDQRHSRRSRSRYPLGNAPVKEPA